MFKKIAKIVIEDCSISPTKHDCFMYQYKANGISSKLLAKYFNGRTLVVYRYEVKVPRRRAMKCPWCGKIEKEIIDHARSVHKKEPAQLYAYRMQEELYSILLNRVRTGHYLATAYSTSECQYCVTPIVPGREGICALPESGRNKIMSFKVMNFDCKGFQKKWLRDEDLAFIIL